MEGEGPEPGGHPGRSRGPVGLTAGAAEGGQWPVTVRSAWHLGLDGATVTSWTRRRNYKTGRHTGAAGQQAVGP